MINAVVDLSHWNTISSYQEIKESGIVGIIHKATQGTRGVDPTYRSTRKEALKNGFLWGSYHFGEGGNVSGQVDHYLQTVSPTGSELLVLDFESNPNGNSMSLAEAEEFVTQINEKTGRYPGLYSGDSFINDALGDNTSTVLSNCFLWIARYSSQSPIVPPAWKTYTFWQYTDGVHGPEPHTVSGIGACDRDKFNGDIAGLKRLWGAD